MTESIEQFLADIPQRPGITELNAGTLSPTPLPTLAAVDRLRRMQAEAPSDFYFHQTPALLPPARAALGRFLNADAKDLFLLTNVTSGINVAMQSIRLSPGDEILTTDVEYGAMLNLLDTVSRRDGSTVVRAALPIEARSPDELIGAIESRMTDRTRVLFISHVSSPTGLILPVRELCAAARKRGILSVVDGAHAPGMIPVDLRAIGADVYGANCHKWMMAPCGVGFLHCSEALKHRLTPLVFGWGESHFDATTIDEPMSAGPADTMDYGSTRLQYRLEYQGVDDRTPALVLPHVVAYLEKLGLASMQARSRRLAQELSDAMSEIGYRRTSPTQPDLSGAMTIFELNSDQASRISTRLWRDFRVLCPVTGFAGRRFLRVSLAWFNTPGQIANLVWALTEIDAV
jgi:isopenicillin-N epimerase